MVHKFETTKHIIMSKLKVQDINRTVWSACDTFRGVIEDNAMQLNGTGLIAQLCWLDIPTYYPYVILAAHVVMPNHVHGIVIIHNKLNMLDDENNDRKWKSGTLSVIH